MPRTPMPPWPKRRRTMTLAALTGTRCERTAHARLSLAKYVRSWSEKIVDRLSRAQRVRLFRRPAVEMLLRCLGIGFRAMDRTVDVLRRSIDGVELQQLVAGVDDVVLSPSGNDDAIIALDGRADRSEEHTSELQSLMRISYAVFCLQKKNK